VSVLPRNRVAFDEGRSGKVVLRVDDTHYQFVCKVHGACSSIPIGYEDPPLRYCPTCRQCMDLWIGPPVPTLSVVHGNG
jgi:hypothetical protein